MKVEGPDSKYVMMWRGAWRPVVNMIDHVGADTTLVNRATRVVLYVRQDYWVAAVVNPGDLVQRTDRNPSARVWEYID